MNKNTKALLLFSGVGYFFLGSDSYAQATTWIEISDYLNQNVTSINNCLIMAEGEYQAKNPATVLESQEMAMAALEDANTCLSPLLKHILDDVEVEFSFRNSSFINEISIEGQFSVELENLFQGSSIARDALNDFRLNNNVCDLTTLNQFTYDFNQGSIEVLKLKYVSSLVDKLLSESSSNEGIALLRSSLDELTFRPLYLIDLQYQFSRSTEGFGGFPFHYPSVVFDSSPLSSYSPIDASPQLQLSCESDEVMFSVENGTADLTVIQQVNSDGGGFSSSFSRGNSTISYNDQTLKIETTQRNNRIETIYQGLPLTVVVDQTIAIPGGSALLYDPNSTEGFR